MTTTWNNVPKSIGTIYTNIPKPAGDSFTTITAGTPIGLLLALTYATTSSFTVSQWKKIMKSSGTTWNNVPKAT